MARTRSSRSGVSLSFAVALALVLQSGPLSAGPQKEAGSRKYMMAFIPKVKSPWYERLQAGMNRAAAELDVTVRQKAPASVDEAEQTRLIDEAIKEGNNAILSVPVDAKSIESALARAQAQKLTTITAGSPFQVNADYDIEMIDNKAFGERAMDEMAKAMGSAAGEYAVYVGSFTEVDHNLRADAAIAEAREKYPGLKLVAERFPVSEDRDLAQKVSLDVIASHPDLRAFLAFGSKGALGAAEAVREKGLVGKIAVIGTVSPREASRYLRDGSLAASILWDPAEAGYAMVYIARLVLDGRRGSIGPDLDIPRLGKPLSLQGNTLVYDRPIVVTRDNVGDYPGF
ncbi:MAG: substrate-binding domain-containing protein [Spirochaetia bacterium]|jgi:simple sugar transport system substrate-binding protein